MAGQLATGGRLAALAGIAPTALRIAGRYVRRQPVKAAGLAVIAGGLFLLGRALLNAATATARAPTPHLRAAGAT